MCVPSKAVKKMMWITPQWTEYIALNIIYNSILQVGYTRLSLPLDMHLVNTQPKPTKLKVHRIKIPLAIGHDAIFHHRVHCFNFIALLVSAQSALLWTCSFVAGYNHIATWRKKPTIHRWCPCGHNETGWVYYCYAMLQCILDIIANKP